MTITERFIKYTQFDTQSSEDSSTVPSTAKQLVFARYLRDELIAEGLSDVEMDDMGYIYATLKGNTSKQVPTIGFIAHYDTSPDCSGASRVRRLCSARAMRLRAMPCGRFPRQGFPFRAMCP